MMSFEVQHQAEFASIAEKYPLGSEVFADGRVYKVTDYEISGNGHGVVGVDREGTERSLYEFEAIRYKTCGRCGGTGRYSFNQRDGTRCYGCSGVGRQMLAPSRLPQRLRIECVEPLPKFRFQPGDRATCTFIGFSKGAGTPLYHTAKLNGGACSLRLITIDGYFRRLARGERLS